MKWDFVEVTLFLLGFLLISFLFAFLFQQLEELQRTANEQLHLTEIIVNNLEELELVE